MYLAQKESQYLGAIFYSRKLFQSAELDTPLPLLLENKKIEELRQEANKSKIHLSQDQLAQYLNIERLSQRIAH